MATDYTYHVCAYEAHLIAAKYWREAYETYGDEDEATCAEETTAAQHATEEAEFLASNCTREAIMWTYDSEPTEELIKKINELKEYVLDEFMTAKCALEAINMHEHLAMMHKSIVQHMGGAVEE